jgi:hypothetical protein
MVNEDLISVQGKDWLIAAIDPFHDHQLKELAGWPDVQSGASVVSTIKNSITIKKPAAAPAGPWTCHIVQWPWLTQTKAAASAGLYSAMTRNGNVMTQSYVAPGFMGPVGGLQVYYVPEGFSLDITLGNGTLLLDTIAIDSVYTDGLVRLIGLGHEVHNTTAMINLQGSVTTWRMMSNENENTGWVYSSTTDPTYCYWDGPYVRYPPANQGQALLLSGSRQWEAKDGSYSVAAFHNIENPAHLISPVCPVIQNSGVPDSEGFIATTNVYAPRPGAPVGTSNVRTIPGFRVHNIHMHGEIYSGLSDQTVLTINQNCFLEKFPGPDDREVLPLATLSAEYDPDVLDLYSRIVSDLPVAVPVMENGLGDWFYDAASTAAKYLGPVLSALPHPMLKGAGVALEGLSSVMEGNNKPKKKRKQTQQAAKQNLPPPNSWGPMVPAARRQQQRNAAKQQPARAGQKPKRKRRNNRA